MTSNPLYLPLPKKSEKRKKNNVSHTIKSVSQRQAIKKPVGYLEELKNQSYLTDDQIQLLKWFASLRLSVHKRLNIGKPLQAIRLNDDYARSDVIDLPQHLEYKREMTFKQIRFALEIHRFGSISLLNLVERLVVYEDLPLTHPHIKIGINKACHIIKDFYLKAHRLSHKKAL